MSGSNGGDIWPSMSRGGANGSPDPEPAPAPSTAGAAVVAVEVVVVVAASAADLAEVSAIVPPPAVADAISFSAVVLGSDESVVVSTSSSSLAIREIANDLQLVLLLLHLIDCCDDIS